MADRTNNTRRSLKPSLASSKNPRTPLTPRVAGNTPLSPRSAASRPPSTVRSEPPRVTPKVKQGETPAKNALPSVNVTPRSSARKSRVDSSQTTPTQADEPSSLPRPRSTIATTSPNAERNGIVGGLGIAAARVARPRSLICGSEVGRSLSPPLVRSPGHLNLGQRTKDESIESRFFHASDVAKQEPAPMKPEAKLKKGSTFFYADGKEEERKRLSPRATSPVLSAISEKRSSGPWIRADGTSNPSRSPPMLSPALSSLSTHSPFFAAATGQPKPRSPSPSKENIHLSYRKGASQIIGTRPAPRLTDGSSDMAAISEERRGSLTSAFTPHRKSPSLSSIDSGNSHKSRRRSATTLDTVATPSPLTHEIKSATVPRFAKQPPSIDTAFNVPAAQPVPESALSPTKSVSELAADARRERKVLDLEISNSSLLAINASLEREVRRQKAELKRFRRLSRAGRFSFNPNERSARFSEGLSTLGEEDAELDGDYAAFGPPSGFTDIYDDFSENDDETESITSGGEPLSPTAKAGRDSDRLAKDEKRLQVDLEKHKELLVQSQMMNQSLKRCMYATEEMIKDGKKALDYHVRVSDVKLGGRILRDYDQEDDEEREEIEAEDETLHGDEEDVAKDFLDVWRGVGRPAFEGSESGDRDSGIEVDKPGHVSFATQGLHSGLDSGRPPDDAEAGSSS